MVGGVGGLFRPYSAGWLELLGSLANTVPYAFLLSLWGGAMLALVWRGRPATARRGIQAPSAA